MSRLKTSIPPVTCLAVTYQHISVADNMALCVRRSPDTRRRWSGVSAHPSSSALGTEKLLTDEPFACLASSAIIREQQKTLPCNRSTQKFLNSWSKVHFVMHTLHDSREIDRRYKQGFINVLSHIFSVT